MVERAEPEVVGGHLGAAVGVPGVVVDGVLERRGVRRLAGLVVEVTGELLDPPYGLTQRPQGRREHLADGAVVAERRLLPEQHQVGRRLEVPVTRAEAGRRPATALSRVDLPVPFSPTRPIRRPGWATRSTPVRAVRSRNETERSRRTTGWSADMRES